MNMRKSKFEGVEFNGRDFGELDQQSNDDKLRVIKSERGLSEVDIVLKEIEQTAYDNPNKKLLFAHEKNSNTIISQDAEEQIPGQKDQVFEVKEEADAVEEDRLVMLQQGANEYAETIRQNWGLFVSSNFAVIDDVDKFRYDVKDNRRLQQVAVHRVFRKTGRFIFQLGIVNFLEQLIIGLLLVIYVFNREAEIYAQAAEQKLGERIIELPYIRTHVSQ